MGTWEKVLKEYGWEKEKKEWIPPTVITQRSKQVEIPAIAAQKQKKGGK